MLPLFLAGLRPLGPSRNVFVASGPRHPGFLSHLETLGQMLVEWMSEWMRVPAGVRILPCILGVSGVAAWFGRVPCGTLFRQLGWCSGTELSSWVAPLQTAMQMLLMGSCR